MVRILDMWDKGHDVKSDHQGWRWPTQEKQTVAGEEGGWGAHRGGPRVPTEQKWTRSVQAGQDSSLLTPSFFLMVRIINNEEDLVFIFQFRSQRLLTVGSFFFCMLPCLFARNISSSRQQKCSRWLKKIDLKE